MTPTRFNGIPIKTDTIMLKWEYENDSPLQQGFEIQRRNDPFDSWSTIATLSHYERIFEDNTTISLNDTFLYQIRTIENDGSFSDWSDELEITVKFPPSWREQIGQYFYQLLSNSDMFPETAKGFEYCNFEYPIKRELANVPINWPLNFRNAPMPYVGIYPGMRGETAAGAIEANASNGGRNVSKTDILITHVFNHPEMEVVRAVIDKFMGRFDCFWQNYIRVGRQFGKLGDDDYFFDLYLELFTPATLPLITVAFNEYMHHYFDYREPEGNGNYWGRVDIIIPCDPVWLGKPTCSLASQYYIEISGSTFIRA